MPPTRTRFCRRERRAAPGRDIRESQTRALMFTLFHHPFCPHSRFVRLAIGEQGLDLRLVEERVWERREAYLAMNPAGTTPVLIAEGRPAIPGAAIIAEYLEAVHGPAMAAPQRPPQARRACLEVVRPKAGYHDKPAEDIPK